MRGASKGGVQGESGESHFKFMKSKEGIQVLTLTIIGAVVHLSTQGVSKSYFLERILKKTSADLKNFFKELGLQEEPCKRRDRDTGEEVPDINVFFQTRSRQQKQKPQKEETGKEGEEEEQGE